MGRLKIVYAILIILAIAIIGLLFYLNLVPSGEWKIASDFQNANPFISPIYPEGRTEKSAAGIIVKEEPVYFDVRLPRKFDTARVKVYFDDLKTRVFELGVEGAPGAKNFTFRPLANQFLDGLGWPRLSEGDLVLYQRYARFGSIADFSRRLLLGETALYRARFSYNYKIPGYLPSAFLRVIEPNLLGRFKFYTYIKNEPLDFKFTFVSDDGFGPITINAWSGDKLVLTKDFTDIPGLGEEFKSRRTFGLRQEGLAEGLYRIDVAAPENTRTEKIVTPARLLSFLGPLRFGRSSANAQLLTSARELHFKSYAKDPANLLADGAAHKLEEPGKRYDVKIGTRAYLLKPLWLPGEIEVEGDGLFAFDWASFFNPLFQNLDEDLISAGATNYILTNYRPPKNENGAYLAEVKFDLRNISPSANRKVRFVFSLPELMAGEAGVRVKKVEFQFFGEKINFNWIGKKIISQFSR